MYGKTTKSTHYLPRTGSYSTVPHRNGRVDVLPPEASELTIEQYEERRERLKKSLQAEQTKLRALNDEDSSQRMLDLRKEYSLAVTRAKARRSGFVHRHPDLQRIFEAKKASRSRVADLQNQLTRLNDVFAPQARDMFRAKKAGRQQITAHFNAKFVRVAEEVLSSEVWLKLKEITLESIRKEEAAAHAELRAAHNT